MSTTNAKQDHKGRFRKGNQAARRHGAKSHTRLLKMVGQEGLDQLLKQEYEKAVEGDQFARQFILSRIIPPMKASHEKVAFKLDTSSLESAARSVLEAISSGDIAPDIGQSIISSLSGAGTVGQMATMAQQLADLTERLDTLQEPAKHIPAPNLQNLEQDVATNVIDNDTGEPTWLK